MFQSALLPTHPITRLTPTNSTLPHMEDFCVEWRISAVNKVSHIPTQPTGSHSGSEFGGMLRRVRRGVQDVAEQLGTEVRSHFHMVPAQFQKMRAG
ncbi:hypothetical protein AVEN_118508-1, partial [Araneus ventricosus]